LTPAPVALDLTRLFVGPVSLSPRGIDRVDLGYARHFFETWPEKCVAILPTPWGVRWFGRRRALRVLDGLEGLWRETGSAESDPGYHFVKARLAGHNATLPKAKARSPLAPGRLTKDYGRFLLDVGFSFGRSTVDTLRSGTIYLNTGQVGLAVPRFMNWLRHRPDVRPVFMLHDVIPIDHPEYVSPRARQFHENMVANTARYASGLIVTTHAAKDGIQRELLRHGRSDLQIGAIPLPVSSTFLEPLEASPEPGGAPYFVVCGAIDPRKNHLLLLNLWRELVARHGANAPKLVVVGSRWRTSGQVIDLLERCELIRDHVIEVSGLSTPALRQLMCGAQAVLMPSFAEGFGIPIVEALASGTPVIASDLPAHREAGGSYATYLSPLDGLGWLGAIQAHVDPAVSTGLRTALESYRPWTWQDYFQQLEPFLLTVQQGRVRGSAPITVPNSGAIRIPGKLPEFPRELEA
jgi:glycosyltransferase involved in cell wall biosynthesis